MSASMETRSIAGATTPPRSVAAVVSQADLRRAIASDELVLHYQPIVQLASGQPVGVEALVRWQHPSGGLLAPDDFVPAVAQTPVIAELTRWVLRNACAAGAQWPGWTVAVNVTARDLAGHALVDSVQQALAEVKFPAARLVLELTETALVQDLNQAAATLGELRELGAGVALDDFGTGYSSMLYLRDLPVTAVKIDREFVGGLLQSGEDRAIVASLLMLARTIGLAATAEGVETGQQARHLRSMGCQLAQGYWWSRPQPPERITDIYDNGLPVPGHEPRPSKRRTSGADPAIIQRVLRLLREGASLHTIAAALNAAGERTQHGSRWHAATVAHLIAQNVRPQPEVGDRP